MSSPADVQARLDAERQGEPFLLYRNGDDEQVITTLTGPVTVGRRPERDVALTWDTEVSRLHAKLVRHWTGSQPFYFLVDMRSTCGTYVNGDPIPPPDDLSELSHGVALMTGVGLVAVTPVARDPVGELGSEQFGELLAIEIVVPR